MSSQSVLPASIWEGNSNGEIDLVNANNSYLIQRFVATTGQSVFTLTSFAFVPGTNSLQIFVNGVYQNIITDYTEDVSGTFFTLNQGLMVGDIVVAIGIVGVTGAPQAAISAAAALASQLAAAVSASASSVSATASASSASAANISAMAAAASALSVTFNTITLISHGTI